MKTIKISAEWNGLELDLALALDPWEIVVSEEFKDEMTKIRANLQNFKGRLSTDPEVEQFITNSVNTLRINGHLTPKRK
jgi:hypothetical protein